MDYSEQFKNKRFPCPLCENKQEIRISDKGKPYIVCDSCGIQLFVRKSEGINRMIEHINSWWN